RSGDAPTGPGGAGLHMNGPEIFTFTLNRVPQTVTQLLASANLTPEAVDLFVFHQANEFILDHLRRKMGIPREKFYVAMSDCGNTTSSSIPIALHRARAEGRIKAGSVLALVGFGVGYSRAGTVVHWPER